MAIRVALQHHTLYEYDRLTTLSPQIVRLRPAQHCRTSIVSYNLHIEPNDHFINWQQDPHGNYLARLVFNKPTRLFSIHVDLVADLTVINPFDFFLEDYAREFPFQYNPSELNDLLPYLEKTESGAQFQSFLKQIDLHKQQTVDFLVALNQSLQKVVGYIIRMEPGVQTPEETLTLQKGSCRDSAWLLTQILRHLGLAARFTSGYLIQLKPDEKSLDGPSGTDKDFTDLHAWCEVYLPGAGWVGLDPTSGLFAGEGHIPLACTPNPHNAAPVSGMIGECKVQFSHRMSVSRIYEDPRVTKPYTDEQWEAIRQAGYTIDEHLQSNDVRLTMGGEPTFVSLDDRDGDEWNNAALGPHKYKLAKELFLRMRDRFTSGALLHFGQGKWYPGESLPRWALACYWRKDNQPIWKDQSRFSCGDKGPGYTIEQAEFLIRRIAEKLDVESRYAIPAWEDPYHVIFQERKTPINIDPRFSSLDQSEERHRLAKILERGLQTVTGYILPLSRGHDGCSTHWISGEWIVRTDTLFLLPGDSPMGYRLPLDSLLWQPDGERQFTEAYDVSAPRPPLSAYDDLTISKRQPVLLESWRKKHYPSTVRFQERYDLSYPSWETDSSEERAENLQRLNQQNGVVRTALCVEPRDGHLYVFLPPLRTIEQFLEMVAIIEQAVAECDFTVRLEGYPPPSDVRIHNFKVTPDPGVIEVNIHPSTHWQELMDKTTDLYEEARLTRLSTEKFMLDGKHTGTHGGNHVVLGGQTTVDSPFLRRPDLLKSLVGYWNNHPSLSYLFSGLFVGPTSQAPRFDEARHEAVYELEVAYRQIPEGEPCLPWLTDRIFRHILTDLTGNTHRAEFCIDKLYSPDSSSGRLGLVEFRNFEMPPHAQMSIAQQLLIRALIARFWETPYCADLVRWGTQLHDRFMLPHFVWQDFQDVVQQTREAGFPLEAEWFDAHFEFRFPKIGSVVYDGVEIELRQAIEPWHVLGEEVYRGSTARYVDSSLERLQVKVSGMVNPRHVITCNGVPVPLHPTGQKGQFCAGVRYRAWQPPSCLHPTIPVHSPLTFDLIDTWNQRSVGGCVYHVVHPGGRNYDRFPVNALEAEARRHNRFYPFGHSGGKIASIPKSINADYPLTLDLRKSHQVSPGRESKQSK